MHAPADRQRLPSFAKRWKASNFKALGGFVRDRVIDADVACNVVSLIVVRNWDALLPAITYIRRKVGTKALWENFEYLALCSKRFIETHPNGRYPRGEPRLPEDPWLAERIESTQNAG